MLVFVNRVHRSLQGPLSQVVDGHLAGRLSTDFVGVVPSAQCRSPTITIITTVSGEDLSRKRTLLSEQHARITQFPRTQSESGVILADCAQEGLSKNELYYVFNLL